MQTAFLISLPRSGSTLLQRLTSTHPQIETAAETWFLLSQLGWLSDRHMEADFFADHTRDALADFLTPARREAYGDMLRDHLDKIMGPADGNVFIDKTPRYSLILPLIREFFPQAKIILLLRNPLMVVNSMVKTWGNEGKRWRVRPYYVDLYRGFEQMATHAAQPELAENCHIVRYEELVSQPQKVTQALFSFLEVSEDHLVPDEIGTVQIEGTMGDKRGAARHHTITEASAQSADMYCNRLRRRWARAYLEWIGRDRMTLLGYDYEETLALIEANQGETFLARDVLENSFQLAKTLLPLRRWASLRGRNLSQTGELR